MIFAFKSFLLIPAALCETLKEEKVREMLSEIIASCFDCSKAQGQTLLEPDFDTIPLLGIDVPFHPHYLWAGVLPSRACEHWSLSIMFHDLYLIAQPFDISREYTDIVYDQT